MVTPGVQPLSEQGINPQTNTERSRELFGDYHGAMNALHDLIGVGYHSGETMMDDIPIYCAVYMPQLGTPKGQFKDRIQGVADDFLMTPEELRISVQRVKRHVGKRQARSKTFTDKFNKLQQELVKASEEYQNLNPVH